MRSPGRRTGERNASPDPLSGVAEVTRGDAALGRHDIQLTCLELRIAGCVIADRVIAPPGERVPRAGVADGHRRTAGQGDLHQPRPFQVPKPPIIRREEWEGAPTRPRRQHGLDTIGVSQHDPGLRGIGEDGTVARIDDLIRQGFEIGQAVRQRLGKPRHDRRKLRRLLVPERPSTGEPQGCEGKPRGSHDRDVAARLRGGGPSWPRPCHGNGALALKCRGELRRGSEAIGRQLLQRLLHRRLDIFGNRLPLNGEGARLLRNNAGDDGLRGGPREGRLPDQHLVEDAAQGIDVGSRGDLPLPHRLLGAHVVRGTERHASFGHAGTGGADGASAMPKSATIALPSCSRMFSGLMSRWITPWWCA